MMVKTKPHREMMKLTMYWLIGIVFTLGLLTMAIALFPKGEAKVGLLGDRLSPCPNTPNCVCSEDPSAYFYIEPLSFDDPADYAWQRVRQAVVSAGGRIQREADRYLWVSFTTKWLRFVDDMELRMDADRHVIHVRSASRVGRSDFGVNKTRVETLRVFLNSNRSDNHHRNK